MASICNNEQALFGVMSGHDRKTLSLSLHRDAFRQVARHVHIGALASAPRSASGCSGTACRTGLKAPQCSGMRIKPVTLKRPDPEDPCLRTVLPAQLNA